MIKDHIQCSVQGMYQSTCAVYEIIMIKLSLFYKVIVGMYMKGDLIDKLVLYVIL